MCEHPIINLLICGHKVDAVFIYIITVKIQIVFYPQKNQAFTSNTDSQPTNIQKAVAFVFQKVSECSVKEIFEHKI